MSHGKSFIIFPDMTEFDTWNDMASAMFGGNYSTAFPRLSPVDGTVMGMFRDSNAILWSGPTKTWDEVMALGYIQTIPPYPPPE